MLALNCAAACTRSRAGRACKPTLLRMTTLVSAIGTFVVLLLSIAFTSFGQRVGACCCLSYFLETITYRGFYGADHSPLNQCRGTDYNMLLRFLCDCRPPHLGRPYRPPHDEHHT